MPFNQSLLLLCIFSIKIWSAFSSDSGLYLHIQTVHRLVNASIVINVEGVKSILHCAYKCKKRSGASLYYNGFNQTCTCNNDPDTSTYHNTDMEAMTYGCYSYKPTVKRVDTLPYRELLRTTKARQDCYQHYFAGHEEDGMYPLFINQTGKRVDVWCSMSSPGDLSGPLTVFQQRYSGPVDFYRPWSDYVSGFGSANGEYWLGLEHIATMTNNKPYGLFITLMSGEIDNPFTTFFGFKSFRLIESENYRIIVSEPSMIESTCFSGVEPSFIGFGHEFAAFDVDNDLNDSMNCAQLLKSAWWFGKSCEGFQINGPMADVNPSLATQPCWVKDMPIYHTSMGLMVTS